MPHYEDGIYVIITVETFREDELDAKMDTVCTICEESGAVEVLEADDRIWNMRRNVQTSCEMISKVFLTDDVVVPVHKIASTIEKIMEIGENYPFQVKINAHIGDGNLHIVLCKMDMSDEEWNKNVEEFHQQVYAYAYSVGGRLAGEHGIGAKKAEIYGTIYAPGRAEGHEDHQAGHGPQPYPQSGQGNRRVRLANAAPHAKWQYKTDDSGTCRCHPFYMLRIICAQEVLISATPQLWRCCCGSSGSSS